MRILIAIVLAGLLIACAVLIAFRWQISAATGGVVYRLDRWTGNIEFCMAYGDPCRPVGVTQ
jgi:hypothetical protein